jgi:hypothetical protein
VRAASPPIQFCNLLSRYPFEPPKARFITPVYVRSGGFAGSFGCAASLSALVAFIQIRMLYSCIHWCYRRLTPTTHRSTAGTIQTSTVKGVYALTFSTCARLYRFSHTHVFHCNAFAGTPFTASTEPIVPSRLHTTAHSLSLRHTTHPLPHHISSHIGTWLPKAHGAQHLT